MKKTAPRASSREGPSIQAKPAQMSAVTSSINGYWIEMGVRQLRHFPPRRSHETIGTLSYQRSS